MYEVPSSSELTKRVRTGIPLATGIALIVLAPTFILGLVVLILAFIGAYELTTMLAGNEDNNDSTVLLPEWLLPAAAVLMGLGALGGESVLHATFLISVAGWIIFELVFAPKNKLSKFTPLIRFIRHGLDNLEPCAHDTDQRAPRWKVPTFLSFVRNQLQ